MDVLFHAHSGLRYLVLLAGVVAVVVLAAGWLGRRPLGRLARIATGAFVGLLDLQVLLGIALLIGGRLAPGIWGHAVLMVVAAAVVHVASAVNRRQPAPRHVLPLAGVLLALTLVVGGILAIRDSVV